MKKITTLLLMFFLCIGLMAQTNGSDLSQKDRATQITQTIDGLLQLNVEQSKKIQEINLICVKMADEIREKYATDQSMLDKKIEETKVHRDERILRVFDRTQMNTYLSTLKDIARFNSISDKIEDKESLEDLKIDVPKVEKLVQDLYNF